MQTKFWRRAALATALSGCLFSIAHAQSVTGYIYGQAPAGAGSSVVVRNLGTGATRTLPVDANGRYRVSDLPNGRYSVELRRDGATVTTQNDVAVNIASGTEVSFAGGKATDLDGIVVRAASMASIDVSQVDTRTVFSYEDLRSLPLPRDITAVALLAPGAIASNSYSGVPSFGGSAASENAYYINGFAVTNPLTSIGSTTLPFEAIAQEQVLTGGYGADFGRSTGGVVNIVTRRGTNEWKAGAYEIWSPESLRASPRNMYYANTGHFTANDPRGAAYQTDGKLYQYRNKNNSWQNTTGAYVGGPIVQDKLFFFVNGEFTKTDGTSARYATNTSPANLTRGWNEYTYEYPRWTAKIDWNITDNHVIELTGVSDVTKYDAEYYSFDYNKFTHGDVQTGGISTKEDSKLYIGKYTSYLTDNLTLSALYGRQKIEHSQGLYNYDASCPYISAGTTARVPGLNYSGCQSTTSLVNADGAFDETKGGRIDLTWRLGNHELRFGFDRQDAESLTGTEYPGGYGWIYRRSTNPNTPIDASHGVSSAASGGGLGAQGYYVYRLYSTKLAQPKTEQASQYIEDRWQVSDNVLLSLGLRNEQFTNYTGTGEKYASQKTQLAPRLGVAWDVHGDSSLKLFANAGRYHLAMPNNVAVRAASGSLNTNEYFTYTGVDPTTGAPTGLNSIPVDASKGYLCPGTNAVASNLECGSAPNPRTLAAVDMKSHYQDEYIIGMEQQLAADTVWGAKFTYRELKSAIDDTCTPALGGACFLFNPGVGNTFWEEQADGSYEKVHYSAADLGLPKLKRKYYALDLFLEKRTDNWYGKVMYTFSRNYGNTEGQLNSDLDTGTGGQEDVSVTQDWDLPQLMQGANGLLPNHRGHVLKAFGYMKLTPEWRVGGSLTVAEGRPNNCTSMYPTPDKGLYDGSYYWYCGLPGSGTTPGTAGYVPPSADYGSSPRGSHGKAPWQFNLGLNVAYTPDWAKGLTLQADVINLLNRQVAGSTYSRYAASPYRGAADYNPEYGRDLNYSTPRYFRFTARYDF
ncbi:TonB-dependent receptor [Stenotrophomonas maltophilia]|uniref:TonB-dependent receptor n=1 Tax=Stenotrophomonas maltophilia TaxID=40324 RepID=UPI000DA2819F|nr:TonB-dependent receptor [Stenotrophomonas maltophilia]SQG11411.1 TonB dependent receptor protein [Stenotrophomonas maltophilia]